MPRAVIVAAILLSGSVFAALVPVPAAAQEEGQQVEGVISEVDGRVLRVATEGHGTVSVKLAARTHVVVQPRQGGHYPDAPPEFLKPGMGVRFRYSAAPLDRVHVTSVPAGAWPESQVAPPTPAPVAPSTPAAVTSMKVRLTDLGGGDRFTADVAGRSRVFRTARPGMMRRFSEGDLVVISVDGAGLVVDARAATLAARVVSVDRRAGRLVVEVDGRERTLPVERASLLDGVRPGDQVRLEIEDRSGGREVVTAIF